MSIGFADADDVGDLFGLQEDDVVGDDFRENFNLLQFVTIFQNGYGIFPRIISYDGRRM